MTLGWVTLGALPYLRSEAESRFTETFVFFASVRGVDPDTLADVDIETVLYANIPGRVKYPSLTVSSRTAVGQSLASQDVNVHVAVGAVPNVRTDHFCRVSASASDASLVGRRFRVKGSPAGGQVTANRYPVEETS